MQIIAQLPGEIEGEGVPERLIKTNNLEHQKEDHEGSSGIDIVLSS